MRKLTVLFISFLVLLSPIQAYCGLEFQGNVFISDKELLRNVNQSMDIDDITDRIKKIYFDSGYFTVQVSERSSAGTKDRIIVIDEGKSSRMARIEIEIATDSLKLLLGNLPDAFNGRVASQTAFNEFAENCINILAENGMPFARGEWTAFDIDESNNIIAKFRIIPGPRAIISEIEFKGIKRSRPRTLEKAAGLKTGNPFTESEVLRAQKSLEKMRYIEISSPYIIETTLEGDSCTVVYNIRELPSTRIEGAGGFINIQGKREFIGRADIEFGDILGTGRRFGLFWKKKDAKSNDLRIKYGEPFVFNSRLNLDFEVYQLDRDTLYITTGAKARLSHEFGIEITGTLQASMERTVPETGSNISNSLKRTIGTEFNYNKADFFPNPASGYEIGSQLEYRYRSNREVLAGQNPPSDITSAGATAALYVGVSRKLVAAARFQGWGVVSANGTVPLDDYRFVGGVNDLRGYTEEQFPAYRYIVFTLEPRLITGKYDRAYLFGDFGIIKTSADRDVAYSFKPGYGFGLASRSGIGQLKVEIGWGKTGFPSEAVFNFGILGSF